MTRPNATSETPWRDPGLPCEAQPKASRANPGKIPNRWGGPGLPCEAQPKASRANPGKIRRSLPPELK
jgi:hypothetical protein